MRPCVRDVLSAVACAPRSATLSSQHMEGLRSEPISSTPATSSIHSPLCNAWESPPLCAPPGAILANLGLDVERREGFQTHARTSYARESKCLRSMLLFVQVRRPAA